MSLPFIRQFPNGRRSLSEFNCSTAEIEKLGQRFIAMGGAYVCEIMPSGLARLAACIEKDGKQIDVEVETVENGPTLPLAVERVIEVSVKHVANSNVISLTRGDILKAKERSGDW